MKSKLTKTLTISLFSTLLIVFVAYKAGCFEKNKSATLLDIESMHQKDSITEYDSFKKPEILPSSKFLVITDPIQPEKILKKSIKDSVKEVPVKKISVDSYYLSEEFLLAASSKSAVIFNPEDIKFTFPPMDSFWIESFRLDSLRKDSLLKRQK